MLFVIHGTDKPNSLEIRTANRDAHLAYLSTFDSRVGGPLLDEDGQMCGSLIILEADSLKAVQDFVANDPYGNAGLFESVRINEFKKVMWPGA